MRGSVSVLVSALAVVACSVDNGEQATFGVPTGAGSSPGSSPGGSGDDSGSDSGSETAGGSGGGDSSGSSTGIGVGESSGGPNPTTGAPGDGSTTGMMPPGNGGQPAMGMYSDCLTAQTDCEAPTNVCFVINGNDGFCTNSGCANAAVDCSPSPGGTATPVCFPIELDMMANMSCALSCAGGLTCPTGMTCYNLAEGSICA